MNRNKILCVLAAAMLVSSVSNIGFARPPDNVGPFGQINQKLNDLLVIAEESRNEIDRINQTVERADRVVAARTTLTTFENGVFSFDLDTLVPPPFTGQEIMRFTLAISADLGGGSPDEPRLRVVTGVPDASGTTSFDVEVIDILASDLKPSPAPGLTVGPYVGDRSNVQISRGNDGLGQIDVLIAVYIELEAFKAVP